MSKRGRRAGHARPKEPQRRCVGCRQVKPQAQLLRLGAVEGEIIADAGRALQGRGCYLCRDPACAAQAVKGRQISRALKPKAPRAGAGGQAAVGLAEPPLERLLSWL